MSLQARVHRIFGDAALEWVDISYVADWICVAAVWLFSWAANNTVIFERDFSPHDPLISHPHRANQVSSLLNGNVALWIPIIVVTLSGLLRKSLLEIHHGIISVTAGRGLARLVTVFLKNRVGRLRPDFLARCKWDEALNACTGKIHSILEGRQSFPSGHSSTAFSGMTFLSLWLAGRTAAWCFSQPTPTCDVTHSRMLRFLLTLIPLFWATFVAVTRIEDYRHHTEDVVVGSIIGILSATICYLIFWPNPFSSVNFARHHQPRILYMDEDQQRRHDGFELTRLEEELGAV
ncbi:lipid phosphate phosphatase 1 [Infundibulicybe gibba]|nr:lipid phosphate phosphatase 1 [Infundibulicybe gibba]